MNRRTLAAAGATALVAAFLPTAVAHAAAPAATRVVDDQNVPCQGGVPFYNSIQAAVDASVPGDVIRVCAGTYHENVVVRTPNIVLRGARYGVTGTKRSAGSDAAESIIDGGSVTFEASSDTLNGFLVRGNTAGPGITTRGTASGHQILNNRVEGNVFGLYLGASGDIQSAVSRNLFRDNNVDGAAAGNGIYADTTTVNVTISGNRFQGHVNDGVLFASDGATTVARNLIVAGNSFVDEPNGHIAFFGGSSVRVTYNMMSNANPDPAGGSSLFMTGVDGVLVQGNRIAGANYSGIAVRAASSGVNVNANAVSGSGGNGIDVSTEVPGGATLARNVSADNAGAGILMQDGTSRDVLRGNRTSGNGDVDCRDDSTGPQRGGVANAWAMSNIGATSAPAGLCHL